MLYDPQMTEPMRQELVQNGFEDLKNPDDVNNFLKNKEETQFLIVNSVCGCAAGSARPGALLGLQNSAKKPTRCGTVFAGVDQEAVAHARSQFGDFPPSSPSMVLFKNGEPVFFVPRHMIEGKNPENIAQDISKAFEEHC